ncbi:MAG: hypothetical protein RR212_10855 [Bacteroidales bacterium]
MYKKVDFKDHITQYPNRKKITDNGNGTSNIESSPGEIISQGTPLNASNMNRIDYGVEDAYIAFQMLLQYFVNFDRFIRRKTDDHDIEFTSENGEVTLTNTKKYPFNSSGVTVSMKQVRKTMNYDLFTEVLSVSGGEVGDIVIYDKQLNGFKVRFTGSATNIKIKYRIRGGMKA